MINEIQIPQSFEDIALEKGRMLALSPIQMGAYMMGARDTYRHLNSKPSGLRWRDATETPDRPGWYHTNVGLIEWGYGEGTELFWLNRFGGHVNKWLDEASATLLEEKTDDEKKC